MAEKLTRGSQWCRWDPHIHAPGTIINDQFGSDDPWEKYLSSLEASQPSLDVIGVTDYYLLDTYREYVTHRKNGRLPDVQLIFPNVELRLDVAARTGFVNLHLLVSPEDENHVAEIERILRRLEFQAHGDTFNCNREDLIRLGKCAKPALIGDAAALEHGATQFKVNFKQLRQVYNDSDWAKNNVLVAVAGGKDDGTSGVTQAADATVREEIEKYAHIIFASSIAQREFWTGNRAASVQELKDRYNGCKPCLHGSDSHHQDTVAQPEEDRYSWIKGEVEFDALRQACIDPEGRAYVGETPPNGAMPSQVITDVSIEDADWAQTTKIPLNSGLIAIIGARGSGKTALADMIAAACDAIPPNVWNGGDQKTPSFLARANQLIGDAKATLNWQNGDTVTRSLNGNDAGGSLSYSRALYLSQQFVEDLCSSTGISDGLVTEIERVVFEAHDHQTTDGATNFGELREQHTFSFQQARTREEEAISDLSDRVAAEFENETRVAKLSLLVVQKEAQIKNLRSDLANLKLNGTQEHIQRHTELNEAVQQVQAKVQNFGHRRRSFQALQGEVASTRATKTPELLRQTQERNIKSGLTTDQWNEFMLIYTGDVDSSLKSYIQWADDNIAKLKGPEAAIIDAKKSLIEGDVALSDQTLHLLQAEYDRIGNFISADQKIKEQHKALSSRITRETATLTSLTTRLTEAKGASDRRRELQAERQTCYASIFEAILDEQKGLEYLYEPLMQRLKTSSGTLKKLGFTVQRIVDVERWGKFAENNLFDLRREGATKGVGSLTDLSREKLLPAWKNGSSAEIQKAMFEFMADHLNELLSHAPYARSDEAEFRAWSRKFAHWLFATDHITIRYEINYDGVDIRKLSPGTRGIVLLLLYLALDDYDERPLIIDQPEENLDPKSVNDELVPLFIKAKSKRQVIIVTHNANLVVNTDADQIIIADAGPHQAGGLPPITYQGGGLENKVIREEVCKILEGGEPAFRARARRLRVSLER